MFKKQPKAAATWYYEYYEAHARQRLNLETPIAETAEVNLKRFLDGREKGLGEQMRAVLAGAASVTVAASSGHPDIALDALLKRYEDTPTGTNSPETRRNNATRVRNVLLAAQQPATAPFSALLPALRTARTAINYRLDAEKSQGRQQSLKRTWNSNLRMIRSIFCDAALHALKEHITLPAVDVLTLRAELKQMFFTGAKKTRDQYRAPAAGVLEATLAEWQQLSQDEFIAAGLALAFGLRRGEIEQADWSWITALDGYTFLDADAAVKDQTGVLRTRALNPFFQIFKARCQAEGWWQASGRCLTGSLNRREGYDRNISEWMRRLGWKTRKHLHALRAWSGSLVYTRYGVGAAKSFCRHGDEKTTRNFYGWLRDEWAEAGQAVHLHGPALPAGHLGPHLSYSVAWAKV